MKYILLVFMIFFSIFSYAENEFETVHSNCIKGLSHSKESLIKSGVNLEEFCNEKAKKHVSWISEGRPTLIITNEHCSYLGNQHNDIESCLSDEYRMNFEVVAIQPADDIIYAKVLKAKDILKEKGAKEVIFSPLKDLVPVPDVKPDYLNMVAIAVMKEDLKRIKSIANKMTREDFRGRLKYNDSLLHVAADQRPKYINNKFQRTDITEIVKYLVEKGVDVNAKNKTGKTPLILFSLKSSLTLTILDILVENGADINARDDKGNTALMYIIERYSSTKFIIPFKKYGADFNVKNDNGDTPLSTAKKLRRSSYINELKNAGAR